MDIYQKSLQAHKQLKGKISTTLRDKLDSKEKLSIYYSPGVAGVSSYVAEHPDLYRDYTWVNNLVAVISDGSAVLGLGDIGPKGAMPVMEGKAMLFKHFADIDCVPIVLDVHSEDEIVQTIKSIAPSFGAINLEDIAAPKCFAIEERLKSDLDIPVFHDDQHGTAIVVLAGLINAMKVVKKELKDTKIVIVGAGAAGTAIIKLLLKYAEPQMVAVDSKGIISQDRTDLNAEKQALLELTNPNNVTGTLQDALSDADIFIGVSRGDLLSKDNISRMAKDPVVFALANPYPEIDPRVAHEAGVAVLATGRSDYPNQVNNALAFPGIFRGALDNKVTMITDEHKIAAAEAIAALVPEPSHRYVIPPLADARLVSAVAATIT